MKIKDAKQHVQFDKPRNGCGMGCCSIGCLGIFGMVIMVGVVGYFGLFHSSLPLKLIESAIEEDGNVEIEGLAGNLSSGFSADEIRFKTVDDYWSNLTDIKFKYDSDSSFFGTKRLVIEELSVNGGTIYADWDPEENELEMDPDIAGEINEIENEFQEMQDEFRDEMGHSPGFRELRVDVVSVANIKIVNPATQLEITIDEMKFEGFQWEEGNLQSLGELLVRSSQLDLVTLPSVEFSGMKNARRFEGTMRAHADRRLKSDVPFVVELAVDDELNVSVDARLFDGRLRFADLSGQTTLSYQDFSPGEYIDLKNGVVLPSKINMNLVYGENKEQGPVQVEEDGSFELGNTRFASLRIEKSEAEPSVLVATGNVNGQSVLATVKIDGPSSPWWTVSLACEAIEVPEDLWAYTLFGNPLEQLTEEQQLSVRATMPQPKPQPEIAAESEEGYED